MISQSSRPGTRLRPGPISVRRNRAFRPAVLGLDMLESRVALSTLSVTAAPYNADPTGVNDATAAIQNCINAAKSGDTVFFPNGTYKIHVVNAANGGYALTLPSGITLAGNGMANSTIRLAGGQGFYYSLINVMSSTNVTIRDLTIDSNSPNNLIPPGTPDALPEPMRAINTYDSANDLTVQRCHFTNQMCSQTICFGGTGILIDSNVFDHIGGGSVPFDQSTIYSDGNGATISNNTMTSANGPGDISARTAMEIHGNNQTISNNTISGFRNSFLSASCDPLGSGTQVFENNTVTGTGDGWIITTSYPGYPKGMSNCTFTGNNIGVNVGAWVNSGAFGTDCYGVGFWGGYLSGALNSLHINGNTFTFSNLAGSRTWDGAINAIRLVTDGSLPTLSDLQIKNNTINNSVGAGMNINLPVNGLTVTGNTITDPGSSPNSIAANSKSAVLIQNSVQNGTIQSNYIIDNYSSAKMQYGIWEGTDNLGNDIYGGNSVQIASGATVPEFTQGAGHQGPAWLYNNPGGSPPPPQPPPPSPPPQPPPPSSGTTLLSSNFANGNTSGWTPVSTSWITGPWQAQASYNGVSNVYAKTGTAEGISRAGGSSWTNYTFTALVNLANLGGGIDLLGRVQDATHYYQLEIRENSAGQVRWWIWKNNGGTWTNLASGPLSYTAGSWVKLGFTLSGSKLTAQMSPASASSNVTSLGSAVDSTWSSGGVGLRAWGSAGRFAQALVVAV